MFDTAESHFQPAAVHFPAGLSFIEIPALGPDLVQEHRKTQVGAEIKKQPVEAGVFFAPEDRPTLFFKLSPGQRRVEAVFSEEVLAEKEDPDGEVQRQAVEMLPHDPFAPSPFEEIRA